MRLLFNIWVKNGCLRNFRYKTLKKTQGDNSCVKLVWKGNTYLEIYYGFDMKTQCDYVYFFDMGNDNIAIVKGQ